MSAKAVIPRSLIVYGGVGYRNVSYYIAENSAICASRNPNDFNSEFFDGSKREDFIPNALIYAEECTNVAVTGPGKICGIIW